MKKLLILFAALLIAACHQNQNQGGYQSRHDQNPGDPQFVGNVGGAQGNFGPSQRQIAESNRKWSAANLDTRHEEFRGRTIVVQTIKTDGDFKEMRLRLLPSADGGDAGMKSAEILEKVAEFSSKRICGRNVKWVNVMYDQPSFQAIRPNPFFDYKLDDSVTTAREYGFTCEY